MSESASPSLSDRYFELIDSIVDITLQGKIRSYEQVYRMLLKEVDIGTGEVFERCLIQRIEATKAQLETKLKAPRMLRALQTIEKQWSRWQQENQDTATITDMVQQILAVEPQDYFQAVVEAIDSNRDQPLNRDKLVKIYSNSKSTKMRLLKK